MMALQPKSVFEARMADKYTGTNSADFADGIADFTVVSESASGLTFTSGGETFTVAPNGYIVWFGTAVVEVFQNEDDYRDAYTVLDEAVSLNHTHSIATGPGEAVSA
jgi:hypothetical protein